MDAPLIDVTELAAARAAAPDAAAPVLLDVRWSLRQPDGSAAFADGHLPGAVYVDLEQELSGHGEPTDGRHPLPDRASLEASARRWGTHNGDRVVVYDDGPGLAAARAWWLLSAHGIDVRLLDGGLAAWTAAGNLIETGTTTPAPGDVDLPDRGPVTLTTDEAAAFPDHGTLVDSRAAERYRGEVEPIDPRAGHVPGAVNHPTTGNVGADGRFRSPEELRTGFVAAGVDLDAPVAAYCGSGITAAHNVLALRIAGVDAMLWPASWSGWSNDPDRPVTIGTAP